MAPSTDHVRAVVARYAEATADNRVFFHPDIPEHRLALALAAYPGIEPEDVLMLLDNTESGDATEGLLLSEAGLQVRNSSADVQEFALGDLRTAEFVHESLGVPIIDGCPTMTDIRVRPETMERVVAMLRDIAEPTTDQAPVERWLDSIGMAHHAGRFREQRVQMEHLRDLDDSDLRGMGIDALGDRKAMLDGIDALRRQDDRASEENAERLRRERASRFDSFCLKSAMAITVSCVAICILTEAENALLGGALVGVVASLVLYSYSLPAVIAFRRGHRHRWVILVANWLLGLTGVAWVFLLCYSAGLFGGGAPSAPADRAGNHG
jgi:hypothetical protein